MVGTLYTPDYSMFSEIFQLFKIFGESWLVGLVMAIVLVTAISRNTKHWGSLFLPVIVSLQIIGVNFGKVMYSALVIGSGIAFITNGLSVDVVGNYLTTVGRTIFKYGTVKGEKHIERQTKLSQLKDRLDYETTKIEASKQGLFATLVGKKAEKQDALDKLKHFANLKQQRGLTRFEQLEEQRLKSTPAFMSYMHELRKERMKDAESYITRREKIGRGIQRIEKAEATRSTIDNYILSRARKQYEQQPKITIADRIKTGITRTGNIIDTKQPRKTIIPKLPDMPTIKDTTLIENIKRKGAFKPQETIQNQYRHLLEIGVKFDDVPKVWRKLYRK